jgi:hypothetical protein
MKIPGTIFLSLVITFAASGQQRPGGDTTGADTVSRITIIDPGISYGKPTLLFPLSLQYDAMNGFPTFLFLEETPGVRPPPLGGMIQQKADLVSPLRLQMESANRLKTLRTVLGTVQLGGVVYLAYRHIKKYGLFK